jgi:hypothetical protein
VRFQSLKRRAGPFSALGQRNKAFIWVTAQHHNGASTENPAQKQKIQTLRAAYAAHWGHPECRDGRRRSQSKAL